jgi:integrase/recombinase XerD
MTPLRPRLIADLPLRGLSERTQEMSGRAVRPLAEHAHKAPKLITAEELRQYFRSLKNVTHDARSARPSALCGITFFSPHTVRRQWTTLTCVRAPRETKRPVILRPPAGRTLLAGGRLPRYRRGLSTISACGLRLQEGTHRPVSDIDPARRCSHGRQGTGAKDHDGPPPQQLLAL